MQTGKKTARWILTAVFAFLTTLALGLDMSVALPNKLLAFQRGGLFGTVNNLLIALQYFHTMDHLTGAVLAAGCGWLYHRYLMNGKKPAGEYLLSAFLAATMLMSEALVAEDTVSCLWAGGTQLVKAMLYMAGIQPLFLAGIRALKQGLDAAGRLPQLQQTSLWARHPFAAPFVTMAVCWLPVWLLKYPGGMSPDVTMQILDYQNQTMTLSHPPLTTVAYGVLYEVGVWLGNTNLGIFAFTLLQTLAMLGVLAFSCVRMRQWHVPRMFYALAVAAYCIAPNYSGYVTSHVKDVPYAIGCILLCVLLIDFVRQPDRFVKKTVNLILLVMAGATIWLWRRNGIAMTIACGLFMMAVLIRKRGEKKNLRRLALALTLTAAVSLGTNAALTAIYDYGPAMKREVYSHLLQMTGRVAATRGDELTPEEVEIIDRVMDYEKIVEDYNPIITDGVKFHFRETATEEELAAYRALALRQMREYPMEYADGYLNLIYRLFDVRSDRGENVDRRELSHPFYLRSYTNLLYDQEQLHWLDAAQEAVENWHFWFADLPIAGLLMNIGLCTDIMLVMLYLMHRERRRMAIAGLLPALLTAGFCLASPVVYIRYALPMTATLPLWFAAWAACGKTNDDKEVVNRVS